MVDFKIKNLNFTYPQESIPALKNINLEINRGEFVVIAGKSGSGKSTLLKMLKPELIPHGEISGDIEYFGSAKENYSFHSSACDIGYIFQNTEYQTVTHSVRTELAFGLENLGFDKQTIALRIAEISAYFALDGIIDKKTEELSGGQKQSVCLAAILAMHPKAVIFDEPASQLDPTAAQNLFSAAHSLCRENGMTIIMTEHRLESIIPQADRLVVLDKGEIVADTKPSELDKRLFEHNEYIRSAMPSSMRIAAGINFEASLPLDIGGGRRLLERHIKKTDGNPVFADTPIFSSNETAVEAKHVYYAYDKSGYVLKDFGIKIPVGSFYALLGANAAGKTTALFVMSGLLPLKSGKIKILGKSIKDYSQKDLYNGVLAVLPQKCESLFSENTVKENLLRSLENEKLSKKEKEKKIQKVAELTEISSLLNRHPYDISGGEMQRAALATVLLKEPKIIFMDEPTKGMDPLFKEKSASIIKELCSRGVTVVAVSHDTEFCAKYCEFCAMISDGMCVCEKPKREFFRDNFYYTTAANKIARDFFPTALTSEEVIELCLKNEKN